MRQLIRRLLLAALFVCVPAAAESPSAAALLQQMQRAYHHYNFELSLIKVRQGNIEPMRFSHALLDKSEISHLIYLNGRPSEYLKLDDQISFFEAGHEPYTLAGARMPGLWSAFLTMN
ncbi:MAG: sigma-E factor regulatory protein RseB domain-containing protein, partial [Aeromonadaceae bacterium]